MKKYLALTVLFLLLAVGCRRGMSTAVYEDELIMPAGEGSPDSLLLSISLEYVRGGVPAPVKEKINQAILSRAFDLEEQDAGLEETAIRYRENLIDEFLTENTGAQGYTSTWEDRTSGTFGESWKKWKNYLFTYYQFRGGAHGLQTVCPLVFDLTTGEVVEAQRYGNRKRILYGTLYNTVIDVLCTAHGYFMTRFYKCAGKLSYSRKTSCRFSHGCHRNQ